MVDEAALGLVGGGAPGAVMGVLAPQSRREAKLKAEELKRNEVDLKKLTNKEYEEDSRVINRAEELETSDADEAPNLNIPLDNVVRRSVTFLKESAAKNPLTDKLYNQLSNYFNNVSVEAGAGLRESARIWQTAIKEQAKTVKIPFTRAVEKNISEGVAKTLRGLPLDMKKYKGPKGKKQLEIINNLAKKDGPLRKLLNEQRNKLIDTGVKIDYVVDYLTQSYKIPMAGFGKKKAIKEFTRILKNNKAVNKKTRAGLSKYAAQIVESIVDNKGTYSPDSEINLFEETEQGTGVPITKKGFELPRTIPTEVVQELDEAGLVNNNAQAIINKYIINAARRGEIQKLYNNFNDKANQLDLSKDEIERTQEIYQALQNNYKRGFFKSKKGRPIGKANEFGVTAGYLTTLPFSGIISLAEPILVLSRVNPKHAIWGALKAAKVSLDKAIRSILPKYPISDLENSFNSIQQTADMALVDVVRDIGDTSINRKITDAFFKATFLAQVTQFSRQMASVAVSQQLQEDILLVSDELKTNKPTAEGNKARQRLNDQGLRNLFSRKKIAIKPVKYPKGKKGKPPTKKQLAKYKSQKALQQQERAGEKALPLVEQEAIKWAESNITEEQAVNQFKLLDQPITDEVVRQRFGVEGDPPLIIKKALTKTIDEIIMSPNVVNRRLWMSNPNLATVAQLKGFMMVFGNTIAPKVYKEVFKPLNFIHVKREGGLGVRIPTVFTRPTESLEGTFKYALTFGLLMSAMYGTQIIKNAIKYEDPEDSPYEDLEGEELLFEFLKQSNILGFGNILIDMAESQKYGQDPFIAGIGPVWGKLNQLVTGISNLTDDRPRTLANWLAKNTPFTGALGTDERAKFPIVGTDAFEEYLESLLEAVDMKEGGSIMDSLISPLNVGESEQLNKALGMLKINPNLLNPEESYYDKHVMPDEFDKYNSPKHFNKKTNSYKVYQLKGEARPTIGPGVYLDDNALKLLGLNNIPKEGLEINKNKVDLIGRERFNNAVNSATKLLKGTKGEAAINLLAERIYQMGLPEISTWTNTLRLLREGKFKEAANESVRNRKGGKAKWVKQTGASRVNSFKKRLKNLQKGK